ncbi:MAG: hypothetical protein DMF84_12145 [Acidobacteria bacterium]|nr:MAG: hypothetical protein DMF84_12145 [Acidobacteriota bacterium]
MTPLGFEQMYQKEWAELEGLLDHVLGRKTGDSAHRVEMSGARLAALYRRACEHLALARGRSYPSYIIDRLERMTADAHQLIYHRREFGVARVRHMMAVEFPSAVRAQWRYVAVAAAAFLLPTVLIAFLVYWRPELILSVVNSETAASFEDMYSPVVDSIGRTRAATTDWIMFGFYIRNNVSVAFQCFAGGLFAGVGTLFFLAYNGAFSGALAGYLTERGLSPTFYQFVATHSAFELTAIVLSGAAGLRIGHAMLAPGRLTRLQSLVDATRESAILLYGLTAMLVIAAAIEAFWSSATWLPPAAKYVVAAACWIAVPGYFAFQGRRRAG